MMQGLPALRVRIPLEHGKVHHPNRCPVFADQSMILSQAYAQRTERFAHHLGRPRAEK